MSKLKLWAVDYWVPFPSSEYGGLEIIAAESREELVQVLLTRQDDWHRKRYAEAAERHIERVAASARELVAPEKPGILESFVT